MGFGCQLADNAGADHTLEGLVAILCSGLSIARRRSPLLGVGVHGFGGRHRAVSRVRRFLAFPIPFRQCTGGVVNHGPEALDWVIGLFCLTAGEVDDVPAGLPARWRSNIL